MRLYPLSFSLSSPHFVLITLSFSLCLFSFHGDDRRQSEEDKVRKTKWGKAEDQTLAAIHPSLDLGLLRKNGRRKRNHLVKDLRVRSQLANDSPARYGCVGGYRMF